MRRMTILVAVFALAMVACGGGESTPSSTSAETTTTEASAGGDAASIARGEELFVGTCSACHGPEGGGIEGLGKNLVGTPFVTDQTVEQLVDFIKVGRPSDHPENTTGIAMLPKGGNPSLTDEDLADIVHFLKSLAE
ncbi:MAG: cytochrome c [Acidimicrobiia bacterium]|nr:cytochrome c [Acidimicrobiia bacterium]